MDGIAEYCREAIVNDEGDELVVESSACPNCGERRMDWLGWVGTTDNVECATCGFVYDPSGAEG